MIHSASTQSRTVAIFAWFWNFVTYVHKDNLWEMVITIDRDCGRLRGSLKYVLSSNIYSIKSRLCIEVLLHNRNTTSPQIW